MKKIAQVIGAMKFKIIKFGFNQTINKRLKKFEIKNNNLKFKKWRAK